MTATPLPMSADKKKAIAFSLGRGVTGMLLAGHALTSLSGGGSGLPLLPMAEGVVGLVIALGLLGPGRYNLSWLLRRLQGNPVTYPYTRKPSDVFGLTFIPAMVPPLDDDADFIDGRPVDAEVTARDLKLMEKIAVEQKATCKLIVEIGVCRNDEGSFTHVLLRHKRPDTVFLGIDVDDKSFLDDPAKNIHTVRTDSGNQALVRDKIRELGNHKIGILFIDGWHSVNMVVNDWKYADLLADDGIVIMHDSNCHPGPVCVFDAVDERLFRKEKFFERERDWGMAIFRPVR